MTATKSERESYIFPGTRLISIFVVFIMLVGVLIVTIKNLNEAAAGDTVTTPISWCAVKGSRATADDPNIPNPYGGTATLLTRFFGEDMKEQQITFIIIIRSMVEIKPKSVLDRRLMMHYIQP